MKPDELSPALLADWESAVGFRLFSEREVPTLTVPEQIAAAIGERILSDRLAPGERIGEQELADEFEVSRGPVRDALRILEREGLVTLIPRRGAEVTALTAQELQDLMEIRVGLFEIAARKLMAQRPADLHALLTMGLQRLEALAAAPDGGSEYVETTYRTMILVGRLTGNHRLHRMMTSISLQTLRYSKLGLASVERRQRSVALLREGIAATARGDVEKLVAVTRQRIEESARQAMQALQTPGRTRKTRP
ncbi:MAG: GntR family transcriptional regulator [Burkholderiales bacterium]|nr:MAG: GntR family transcriptional regulator [Burkholderiales bacterium]